MAEPAAAASGASVGGQTQGQANTATGGATPGQGPANPYGSYPNPPYAPYGYSPYAYYPYPYYAYPYYAYPYAPQPLSSGWAIASLACGVAGFVGAGLIGSVLAIIFGYIGLNEIKKSGDVMQGRGMAIAGLVMGYVGAALSLIFIVVYFGFFFLFLTAIPATSGGFIH